MFVKVCEPVRLAFLDISLIALFLRAFLLNPPIPQIYLAVASPYAWPTTLK